MGHGWRRNISDPDTAKRSSWYAARLEFLTTNNIAKYEAMLLGLRKLGALSVRRCIIKSDSQVVVGYVEKEFTAKEPELIKYLAAVRRMEKHFVGFSLRHIPRSENLEADELAKAAAQKAPLPADMFFQALTIKAIKEEEDHPHSIHAIASEDWRAPIFAYLTGTFDLESKHEIERMNSRTKHYSILAGELYKSGIVTPMLKYISKDQGIQLLAEMHSGMLKGLDG
jgi:ribonuclease HI